MIYLNFTIFWVEKNVLLTYGENVNSTLGRKNPMTNQNLFAPDAVFISNQTKQDLVFKEVYEHLRESGYVKGNFYTILSKESIIFQRDWILQH